MITHNDYDHSDANQDINVVFPLDRLGELESEGMIGGVAQDIFQRGEMYGLRGGVTRLRQTIPFGRPQQQRSEVP